MKEFKYEPPKEERVKVDGVDDEYNDDHNFVEDEARD